MHRNSIIIDLAGRRPDMVASYISTYLRATSSHNNTRVRDLSRATNIQKSPPGNVHLEKGRGSEAPP